MLLSDNPAADVRYSINAASTNDNTLSVVPETRFFFCRALHAPLATWTSCLRPGEENGDRDNESL